MAELEHFDHILCYGSDARILQTRRWVLERAGYRISVATEEREFLTCLERGNFDLLLLCHSLNHERCERAMKAAQPHRPQLRVLLLEAGSVSCTCDLRDLVMNCLDGPRALISAVQHILATSPEEAITR